MKKAFIRCLAAVIGLLERAKAHLEGPVIYSGQYQVALRIDFDVESDGQFRVAAMQWDGMLGLADYRVRPPEHAIEKFMRLIPAAPELLAACKSFVDVYPIGDEYPLIKSVIEHVELSRLNR